MEHGLYRFPCNEMPTVSHGGGKSSQHTDRKAYLDACGGATGLSHGETIDGGRGGDVLLSAPYIMGNAHIP